MRKNHKIWLLFTLMLIFVLAACSGGGDENSSESSEGGNDTEESSEGNASGDQTITVTAKSEIPSMDPSLITDSVGFQWAGETLEGLYRLDENSNLTEGMAKEGTVS
ncbi:MAG: peptide ABC transporter substrate-binding protein, partial [Halobacillus sp.]